MGVYNGSNLDNQKTAWFTSPAYSARVQYFPTDIRLNYEKYWYPNDGKPKESEQDKLVAELMIRF